MMRPYVAIAPLLCLSVATACADLQSSDSDKGSDSDSAETGGMGATLGEPADPSTGEPVFEPIPARGGIVIERVEANSGVAVMIGKDGEAVGGSERTTVLPPRRNTLFRAYVKVPEGWEARELEARLHLTGGGVDKVYKQKMLVKHDSRDSDINSTFSFGVAAADVQPGLKYSVELWETAPGQEDTPEGDVPPRAPYTGSAFVGIEDAYAHMRVVLVPVAYEYGSCKTQVDAAAVEGKFKQALFQQNPLESLDFTIHEPYSVGFDLTVYQGLSRLVSEMSQLRTAEKADPSVYYYALFDNCGECIGGGGGVSSGCTVGLAADITGDKESDAWRRVAAGQLIGKPEETFVHEIGHTQGRRHIECPGGNSQGNDGTYPHANGVIGVWGFGIQDIRLRHPNTHSDYMSYCGSTWVSDWQWFHTFVRIRTLSQWDLQGKTAPDPDEAGGLLIGAIDDGQEMWWTVPGSLEDDAPRSATHSVEFEFADGVDPVAAQVSVRAHGNTLNVVAPLPAGFDRRSLQRLTLHAPEGASEVPPTAVRYLHRPDRLKAAR
jgi:hypothetical protein